MRSSKQEWARRVERWRSSGLSGREFAAQMNIKLTFRTFEA